MKKIILIVLILIASSYSLSISDALSSTVGCVTEGVKFTGALLPQLSKLTEKGMGEILKEKPN